MEGSCSTVWYPPDVRGRFEAVGVFPGCASTFDRLTKSTVTSRLTPVQGYLAHKKLPLSQGGAAAVVFSMAFSAIYSTKWGGEASKKHAEEPVATPA